LRDHPGLDVNWANGDRWTALHCAAWEGHVNVVKVLLAHAHINVNVRDTNDATPFLLGCDNGVAVVRVLLKDLRVDVTQADQAGCTPL